MESTQSITQFALAIALLSADVVRAAGGSAGGRGRGDEDHENGEFQRHDGRWRVQLCGTYGR